MSFGPNFIASLDDEVRAFIHMTGIELHETTNGFEPLMYRGGMWWRVYLHRGDPRTIDYWREVALRAYGDARAK